MKTPSRNRVVEAAMAILQATPTGQLGITVMNKALFYADLCALRDLGETITRSGYIALPQGPVLNHYAVGACDTKLGNSISPIKSGIPQGKGLKVRFGYPGCGKSGGLRLAILAFCDQQVVKIAGAWIRREDPDDDDFAEAFDAS